MLSDSRRFLSPKQFPDCSLVRNISQNKKEVKLIEEVYESKTMIGHKAPKTVRDGPSVEVG